MWIDRGILHQPLIVHPAALNLQVSISHCDELGAALVFPEALPMGLDVEHIRPARQAVLAAYSHFPSCGLGRGGACLCDRLSQGLPFELGGRAGSVVQGGRSYIK